MNSDEIFIDRCIKIAQKGKLYVAPNPMVGCLFVHDGVIVSEGYHQKFGGSHAEVDAYNSLPSDVDPQLCDVYVSLEPCSYHGKTPPCTDLLVKLKPKRVVIGCLDPNPKVSGAGVKTLIEAGIEVIVDVLREKCELLNKYFFKAQKHNLPFVTLKWAQTKNRLMARKSDSLESSKISDIRNDSFVHQLRASHQAILVGANTVNTDNPLLDVRFSEGNNPIKVILSPDLSVDFEKQTFNFDMTLVFNKMNNEESANYQLIQTNPYTLERILSALFERGIHSVLVEGGIQVIQAFIDSELWDEAIIIESNKSWNNGRKAPKFNRTPSLVKQSYDDNISFFNK